MFELATVPILLTGLLLPRLLAVPHLLLDIGLVAAVALLAAWLYREVRRGTRVLAASERRLRALIEHSTDVIALLDADGTVRYANPAITSTLGYPGGDLRVRNALEWVHSDDRETIVGQFLQLLQEPGKSVTAQFRCRHADGSWRWVECVATNLLAEPSVRAVVCNFRDTTEARLAREEIERLNTDLERRLVEFQTLLDVLPIGIAIATDPECRTIISNPYFARVLGIAPTANASLSAPEPERPTNFRVMRDGQEVPVEELPMQYAASHGVVVRDVELDVVHEDGRVVRLLEFAAPLFDEAGRPRGCVGAFLDITERKRLEEELRERAEALAEADRRKDEFLAMLAHELRNPLAPILTALEVLREPASSPAARERARAVVERQVRHMARLLDDLLDVSRLTRGQIQLRRDRVELKKAVANAVETVRPLIEERGHTLTLDLPSEPIQLWVDPTRLEQILTNLLNNAAKYTDPGGRIVLTVKQHGGELRFSVRDTGVGIAPEMLPRIFDLFVQGDRSLDRSQGGMGVGLTLVRRLVELHGGQIEAHSDGHGRGSEFVVRLPLVAGPESAVEQTATLSSPSATDGTGPTAPRIPHTARRRKILVVDDSRDTVETLAELLRLEGYAVQTAFDGKAALTAAAKDPPDAVLIDIGLPGMDGCEVARALRRQAGQSSDGFETRPFLLIAITGYDREEDRRRIREAGFDHHLVKPIEMAMLRGLLETAPRPAHALSPETSAPGDDPPKRDR